MQVFELQLKFVVIWNIRFKYLKIGEMFLQDKLFGILKKTFQYWCGEHFNIYFLVNGIFFHNENHPQLLKNDVIIGNFFKYFFKSKW